MIAFTGRRTLLPKSDGEPAMAALKGAIKATSVLELGVEVRPAGDSLSNGEIEGAVGAARGQARA